jgi:diguanylate cyclase (GGDEF)-like protein
VREQDVAARYGGEEFAVLLRGLDSSAALVVAERIRERTEQAIIALAPGLADRITVSIGLATAPENGMQRMELLAAADRALYRAKQDGRNRVAISGENPDAALTPAV